MELFNTTTRKLRSMVGGASGTAATDAAVVHALTAPRPQAVYHPGTVKGQPRGPSSGSWAASPRAGRTFSCGSPEASPEAQRSAGADRTGTPCPLKLARHGGEPALAIKGAQVQLEDVVF